MSMRGSGVGAGASDNKTNGGGSKGPKIGLAVVKWSCHLAITNALSYSSGPSVDINGADTVVQLCHSWWNLATESFISQCSR